MLTKRILLARPVRQGLDYSKVPTKKPGNNPPLPPSPYKGGEGEGVLPQTPTEKKDKVGEIVNLASGLTESQRKSLMAQLALEGLTIRNEDQRDTQMWASAVYDGLASLQGGPGDGIPGPAVVRRLLTNPSAWAPMSEFMKVTRFDTLTVTERAGVYRFLASLVIQSAVETSRYMKIPLSVKMVGNHATKIRAIFDQHFPGYLASGLSLIVAKRLISA